MAVTVTDMAFEPRSISNGPKKFQFVTIQALSGATSGTVTADRLNIIEHIIVPGIIPHTAAPTFSGNVATLAFTVPAETAASRTIDGILYTAAANQGAGGNSITIQIVDGTGDSVPVVPGSEVVQVTSKAIVVRVDPTLVTGSTRNQVKTAIIASAAASLLVTPSTVTAGTTVASVTAATPLQSGVTGGYIGNAICIGR